MNFLITGAAGFLGSSLANHLAREGHQTRGLDDLSTGDPQALAPDVHFTRGDVSDRPKLWTLLQEVDVVYHLAARVSVPESVLYPRDYDNVNVGGTVALMEAMRDVGVRRVVLASSGAVYGDQADQPLKETLTPNPRSPYAVSKLAAEYYVRTIGGLWGIETVSLRIFNAYGTRSRTSGAYGAVFGVFLKQKIAGKPFTVVGDGTQTRDFLYVTDVARAFLAAAETERTGRCYNLGAGKPQSVNRLVELLGGEKVYIPKRPGEPDCTWADISRITTELNWKPELSFEEGVARIVENIDYWKNAPLWEPDSIARATKTWFKYMSPER